MAITGTLVGNRIAHALGRDSADSNDGLASELPILAIVNEAGQYLVGMHQWKWLEEGLAYLRLRADVTITASNAGSSSTIEITASTPDITDYTVVTGDQLHVITPAANEGYVEIASRSSSTLTLADGSLDGVTLTSAEIVTDTVALPSDFRAMRAWAHTDGLIRGLSGVTLSQYLDWRTTRFSVNGSSYIATVSYVTPVTAGAPVPVLRVYPSPTVEDLDGFTIVYKRGWGTLSAIGDTITIPDWMEPLMYEIAIEYAKGYEKSQFTDLAPISQRLAAVKRGENFAAAALSDGNIQRDYGLLRNGMGTQEGSSHLAIWRDVAVSDLS